MMQMFAAVHVSLVMAVSPVAAVGWQSSETSRPAVSQVRAEHAKKKVTLTGLVEWSPDIEGGCLTLRTPTRTYQLRGTQQFTDYLGTTQTMRGRIRTDLVSRCHIPVFEVTRILVKK